MGRTVIEHIIVHEDQGPSKEGGPGWYRHPSQEDISKVSEGKTVYVGLTVPI